MKLVILGPKFNLFNKAYCMKTSLLILLVLNFTAISCGKKSEIAPPMFATANSVIKTDSKIIDKTEINERNCIEEKLAKELDSGESIVRMVINSDIDFCNGVRVRLKSYLFSSKKYKVYGFVRSNSGHETCVQESDNYTHKRVMMKTVGDEGVLVGENIKILLGGHEFDSDNKLKPSEHKLARFVRFDWGTYHGEMGIVEKDRLRCWAIQ